MQVISVKYREGVFVPDVPIQLHGDPDAVVVISDEKPHAAVKSGEGMGLTAAEEYKAKYPNDSIEMTSFKYVGILEDATSYDSKKELIRVIEGKYDDM